MIEPLRFSFVLGCSAQHAFDTWTVRAPLWWPVEHTVSQERGVVVVFEPRAGGRIYERTPQGREIAWGYITTWDRPRVLAYEWHIATDPKNATHVEIRFVPESGDRTRVEIEHSGWEQLGELAVRWREENYGGWDGVLPHYRAACVEG